MLWWLVDNVGIFQIILGICALGFAAAFYLNKRVKFLAIAGAFVAGIALFWLLSQLIVTDRKRLEINVREMADAVVTGKEDVLLGHWADDFQFQGINREPLAKAATRTAKHFKVDHIRIWGWQVDNVDRKAGTADVNFGATAEGKPYRFRGRFRLVGDQWKLQRIDAFNPLVDQDTPINIPIR